MTRRHEMVLLLAIGASTVLLTGALFSGNVPMAATAEAADTTSIPDCPDLDGTGMRDILNALKAKERTMTRREKSIDAREEDLRQVEKDLQVRLDDLVQLRDEVRSMLEGGDEEREERVKGLVKMVESMRPAQAALIFAELEEDLAVNVLEQMNRAKAGKLLASMTPNEAANLAEQLTEPLLWELP